MAAPARWRVLVVSNDGAFTAAATQAARELPVEVSALASGESALTFAESGQAHLLIVDLELADGSGWNVLRGARSASATMPIIAALASVDLEDARRLFRRKVTDVVGKPLRPGDLVESAERALADLHGPRPAPPAPGPARAAAATSVPPRSVPPASTPPSSVPPRSVPPPSVPPRSTPPEVTADLAVFAGLEHDLETGSVNLPAIDPRVIELQGLMQRGDGSADEVVAMICRDTGLAAAVLRAANSGFFRGGRPIATLRDACVRLGNRQVFAIAIEVLLNSTFARAREPYAGILAGLWRVSAATARLAMRIARRAGLRDPEGVYLAALMHNVGELCMIAWLGERGLGELDDAERRAAVAAAIMERHEAVGRRLCELWKQPPLAVDLAGTHHGHRAGDRAEVARTREVVMAAWALAAQTAPPPISVGPLPEAGILLARLGHDESEIAGLRQEAERFARGR
jgi:HD-like signal output (HDOD) protein